MDDPWANGPSNKIWMILRQCNKIWMIIGKNYEIWMILGLAMVNDSNQPIHFG